MKWHSKKIHVQSHGQIEFIDITGYVQEIVSDSGIREGQVTVYSPHTTASIVVNHGEPMLLQDFTRMLYRLAPISDRYAHDIFEITRSRKSDGRSNGHSHCKALLLNISETLPIEKGKIYLTDKQNIFLVELDGSRSREIIIQVFGI